MLAPVKVVSIGQKDFFFKSFAFNWIHNARQLEIICILLEDIEMYYSMQINEYYSIEIIASKHIIVTKSID